MMMGLSLYARRIIAVAMLLLLILCSIEFIIIPSVDRIKAGRSSLANSRFELARLNNIINRSDPPLGQKLDNSLLIKGEEKQDIQNIFNNHISAMAQQRSITVDIVFAESEDTSEGLLIANISALGEETSVIGFMADLENGRPLVRLADWSISYQIQQPTQVQFDAQLMASWVSE